MNAALRQSTRHAANVVRSAAAFLYPPVCARCSAPLPVTPSTSHLESRWCQPCLNQLTPPISPRCFRCSAPVGPYLDTNSACIHCRSDRFAFERAVSIGIYDGTLREACLAAKQPGGHTTAAALGDLLALHHGNDLRQQQLDLVVPLPHHWLERIARPHLPPDVIARRLARYLGITCDVHVLAKTRRTPPQSSLHATDRRRNLRGAFRVRHKTPLARRNVLLVDDVFTTGTTAHRAARELLAGGAARVLLAVAARSIARRT